MASGARRISVFFIIAVSFVTQGIYTAAAQDVSRAQETSPLVAQEPSVGVKNLPERTDDLATREDLRQMAQQTRDRFEMAQKDRDSERGSDRR